MYFRSFRDARLRVDPESRDDRREIPGSRVSRAPRNDGINFYSAAWRWLRASRSSASSATV
jgi:hypothetical protein